MEVWERRPPIRGTPPSTPTASGSLERVESLGDNGIGGQQGGAAGGEVVPLSQGFVRDEATTMPDLSLAPSPGGAHTQFTAVTALKTEGEEEQPADLWGGSGGGLRGGGPAGSSQLSTPTSSLQFAPDPPPPGGGLSGNPKVSFNKKVMVHSKSSLDSSAAKYAVEQRDLRPAGSVDQIALGKATYSGNVVVPFNDAEEMGAVWDFNAHDSMNKKMVKRMDSDRSDMPETPKSGSDVPLDEGEGGGLSSLTDREREKVAKRQMEMQGGGKKDFLDPSGKFFRVWDIVMAVLLFYTGIVTPFEVSYLATNFNAMFVINRMVDACFLLDMALNFVIPYQNKYGIWVNSRRKIVKRYISSWFPVDIVSIFPFDMLGYLTGNSNASNLKVLRIVRLLRLAKLLRILRVGRVFRRWESSMAIDYMKVELVKFIAIVLAIAHWLACAWHMVIDLEDNSDPPPGFPEGPVNWIDNYAFLTPDSSAFSKYIASLYWSVATLSTLGYGDVVPSTDAERTFVVVCTIIGSSIYAYMVGNVCGLISGMDARNAKFYETMRNLNVFMEEKRLPGWLQIRLRDFFRFRRNHSNISDYHDLLSEMSPALRSHVSGHIHRKWVTNVKAFRGFSSDAVAAIAMHLDSNAYSACESIFKSGEISDSMYIVERGVVLVNDRVVVRGGTFGEDMMYRGTRRRTFHAVTLTHVVLLSMHCDMLNSVIDGFPAEKRKLRKSVVRVVFRDCVISYVKAIRKMSRGDFAFKKDWEQGFDENVLPLVYTHKYRAVVRDKVQMKQYIHAVQLLQRAMKRYVARKARERELEAEEHQKKAWPHLLVVLDKLNFREYEDVLQKHEVTLDTMSRLTAGDLCLIGIPLGRADRLIVEARNSDVEGIKMKGALAKGKIQRIDVPANEEGDEDVEDLVISPQVSSSDNSFFKSKKAVATSSIRQGVSKLFGTTQADANSSGIGAGLRAKRASFAGGDRGVGGSPQADPALTRTLTGGGAGGAGEGTPPGLVG